jgi:hypothetical protein
MRCPAMRTLRLRRVWSLESPTIAAIHIVTSGIIMMRVGAKAQPNMNVGQFSQRVDRGVGL